MASDILTSEIIIKNCHKIMFKHSFFVLPFKKRPQPEDGVGVDLGLVFHSLAWCPANTLSLSCRHLPLGFGCLCCGHRGPCLVTEVLLTDRPSVSCSYWHLLRFHNLLGWLMELRTVPYLTIPLCGDDVTKKPVEIKWKRCVGQHAWEEVWSFRALWAHHPVSTRCEPCRLGF